LDAGLIVNLDDYRSYNGFESNIRTKYLSCKELERLKGNLVFWGNFNPVFLARNYFLRNHFAYYLKAAARDIALYLRYLLISGEDPRQLDI